jgi:2-hydroxy-3-keto-5-methylthiopentenyl-1-phosphate phosphatase
MAGAAYLCDFDGTISPKDIGEAFVRRFTRESERELEARIERWRKGEMGHRELTVAECGGLAVSEQEALDFTRGFGLDPHFAGFVREASARGDRVMVVSEGFDFYVRDLLRREGLGDLAWAANGARFEHGGVRPEFPLADSGCGQCGNCKGRHVRNQRATGFEVVLVGDGFSDRCGAREADVVLARGDLLEWCRAQGIAATPFEDFSQVSAWARARPGARAAARVE